jgi:hypothetical protein
MQIDIILRTYDHKSVHPRRFDKPKRDIVWRCVRSLMTAIKNVPKIARYWPYFEERLTFNKLWNTEVGMYCPLVPLSYHLWEDHPYYPVKDLWEANKCLELAA